MKPKAVDLAKGKWPGILVRLGFDARVLDGRKHPCPTTGEGKDRFRFTDHGDSGAYFCHCHDRARSGASGGMSLLMCRYGWTYQQACEEVEKIVGAVEAAPPKRKSWRSDSARKREIVSTCGKWGDFGDTMVRYLAARQLAPTIALRQGRAKYWESGDDKPQLLGEFDVMVAHMRAPDGTAQALHVTYLDGDRKADVPAPRKMIGTCVKGSAIRLFDAAPVMGVAEGIETALAAAAIHDIPVWACHCADMLAGFIPPDIVTDLWIFADNDANAVGQIAGFKLKQRMHREGRRAFVHYPPRDDTDWNDQLIAEAA